MFMVKGRAYYKSETMKQLDEHVGDIQFEVIDHERSVQIKAGLILPSSSLPISMASFQMQQRILRYFPGLLAAIRHAATLDWCPIPSDRPSVRNEVGQSGGPGDDGPGAGLVQTRLHPRRPRPPRHRRPPSPPRNGLPSGRAKLPPHLTKSRMNVGGRPQSHRERRGGQGSPEHPDRAQHLRQVRLPQDGPLPHPLPLDLAK